MKWRQWLLFGALVSLLVACGDEKVEENENLQIEDGDVQVTLPPQFFQGQDEEDIRADAEEQGIKGVELLEDGSVTYTLTEGRHKEIVDGFKDDLDFAVKDIAESENYPSVKKVEAKEDYKAFDIYVDRAQFEQSGDMIATITLYIGSSYYHGFLGNANSLKVTLNYFDEANGELIESISLPKDLDKTDENG